jgi:hypothetical protein
MSFFHLNSPESPSGDPKKETRKEFHMANELTGKRIAIVVMDGFEQDELVKPKEALVQAGAEADIVSPNSDKVRGWKYTD